MPSSSGRACIIGAGAAGLCAARHLLHFTSLEPVVYEQTEVVGGTWVYNEAVGTDKHGQPIHASMYKGLVTNLPREVMMYSDFAFPPRKETESSFMSHVEVREYLENYCTHFRLRGLIRFEHRVHRVQPLAEPDELNTKWTVTVDDLVNKTRKEEAFDTVLVCNGHYTKPYFAPIPGLASFEGKTMHSHDYRTPQQFTGLRVVILGAAGSGVDISLEISSVVAAVYLSHNDRPLTASLPDNLAQVGGIKECVGRKDFLLHDQSVIQADVLLFCTGYQYSFPFLSQECSLTIQDRVADPLYKHMLHAKYPSLAFIGVPLQLLAFLTFDYQMKYFRAVWTGKTALPNEDERLKSIQEEKQRRLEAGIPKRHFHRFGPYMWTYLEDLADLAQEPRHSKALEKLFLTLRDERMKDPKEYKKLAFELINGQYVILKH